MNVHALRGCSPQPLAHYLKGLGVLRLVAEQADEQARGFWKDECFHLVTKLAADELVAFFLERYQPTAVVSPWNKGSGFYQKNDPGLTPIEKSTAMRFLRIREGVAAARALIDDISAADAAVRAIKDESKRLPAVERARLRADPQYKRRLADADRRFRQAKQGLIPRCRKQWRGPEREWMDAALVLASDLTPVFPALLGTGGNDGRLDFTNNFYQRLTSLFDFDHPHGMAAPAAKGQFASALWGSPLSGLPVGVKVGQFLPGLAGGANATNGPVGESRVNPADFVLMLEGALLFRSAVSRRLEAKLRAQATVPFATPPRAAGYASAAASDEGQRGEQWMPLWSSPASVSELRVVLAEGRVQMEQSQAREPFEFARAVARLGSARGIDSFQRFGFIERQGQSNLAIPIGRFDVPERPLPRTTLLDPLDPWLARLKRQARAARAVGRLVRVEQQLSDALFAVVQSPAEPTRWQRVLVALGAVECVLASGTGLAAGPLPSLDPQWIVAADDGTHEFRLAVVLALSHGLTTNQQVDSVRRHWLPLDATGLRFETTGEVGQQRLARKPDVVVSGRDAVADAIALLERRALEATQAGARHIGLVAARRASAALSDLSHVLSGTVDLSRTVALALPLMAVNRRSWNAAPPILTRPTQNDLPDDAWVAIRLALLPWDLDRRRIGNDPAIVRRLAAGDAPSALELASRRLRAAGLHCPVRMAVTDAATARLWAAALAFPIDIPTARYLARRLDPASNPTE